MVEKKEKKKTKTIRIWRNFQQKLQEMKKKGECISTIVERCLTTKVNLNDILEEEGIEVELGLLDGMKIMTPSLSAETIQKLVEIKETISSFSASVVANFCLMFRDLTIDSILQGIKGMKITGNPGDPIPEHILEHTRRVMKK